MLYSHPSHARFPVTSRNAEPLCDEKFDRTVRGALLRAAALHPIERTGRSEESARRPGANSAGATAAAAAAAAAAGSGVQGAGGWTRELPVRLHSRGEQHGQFHGAD